MVDGVIRSDRLLGCSFALVVPCPLSTSGTVALDTTRLADGEHDLELVLSDATLANHVRHGPVRITRRQRAAAAGDEPAADLRHAARGRDGLRRRRHLDAATASRSRVAGSATRTAPGRTSPAPTGPRTPDGARRRPQAALPRPRRQRRGRRPTPTRCRPRRCRRRRVGCADTDAHGPAVCDRRAHAGHARTGGGRRLPNRCSRSRRPPSRAPAGSTITVRWGERRRVSGTLLRPDGRPVAGARLAVTSRVRALDAEPRRRSGTSPPTARGRFSYVLGSGVSRVVDLRLPRLGGAADRGGDRPCRPTRDAAGDGGRAGPGHASRARPRACARSSSSRSFRGRRLARAGHRPGSRPRTARSPTVRRGAPAGCGRSSGPIRAGRSSPATPARCGCRGVRSRRDATPREGGASRSLTLREGTSVTPTQGGRRATPALRIAATSSGR